MTREERKHRAALILRRRAIDKAILAECERQIAAEEESVPKVSRKSGNGRDHLSTEERAAIARAFGRPVV